jgi:hypothetical protein
MNYEMTANDRLKLQEMIKVNDVENNTEVIRKTKHSSLIRLNVELLEKLKQENREMYKNNFSQFDNIAIDQCNFLFMKYTDLYNKLIKNELNLEILYKFLDALEMIEKGDVDQHEASVKVGAYLKELYVDSALKKEKKLDDKFKESQSQDPNPEEPISISWSEYKEMRLKK